MTSSNPLPEIDTTAIRWIEINSLQQREIVRHLPPTGTIGIISAPGAATLLGAPWWHRLTAPLTLPHILDCDMAVATAAWALRHGQRLVVAGGNAAQMNSLRALAALCGGTVLPARPPVFTLDEPPLTPYRQKALLAYITAGQPATEGD